MCVSSFVTAIILRGPFSPHLPIYGEDGPVCLVRTGDLPGVGSGSNRNVSEASDKPHCSMLPFSLVSFPGPG